MSLADLPTMNQMIGLLQGKDLVLGLALLGAGLIFILWGLRVFTTLIAVSFAALGFVVGMALPVSETMRWVCGGVGGVVLAVASTLITKVAVAVSITFVMYEQMIALVTSLEGAFLFVGGLVICLSHHQFLWQYFRSMLVDSLILGPFFIFAGTLIGFCYQVTELCQKETGQSG